MTAAQSLVSEKIKELLTSNSFVTNTDDVMMVDGLLKMASRLVKPLHMKNIYKLSVSAILLPGYSSMSFLFPKQGADITLTIKPSFFGLLAYVRYTESKHTQEDVFDLEDLTAFEAYRNEILRRAGVY